MNVRSVVVPALALPILLTGCNGTAQTSQTSLPAPVSTSAPAASAAPQTSQSPTDQPSTSQPPTGAPQTGAPASRGSGEGASPSQRPTTQGSRAPLCNTRHGVRIESAPNNAMQKRGFDITLTNTGSGDCRLSRFVSAEFPGMPVGAVTPEYTEEQMVLKPGQSASTLLVMPVPGAYECESMKITRVQLVGQYEGILGSFPASETICQKASTMRPWS